MAMVLRNYQDVVGKEKETPWDSGLSHSDCG